MRQLSRSGIAALAMTALVEAVPAPAQFNSVNPGISFGRGHGYLPDAYEEVLPPDSVSMPPAERARFTLNGYASCLVQKDRKAVETMLALPEGKAASEAAASLSVDECLASGDLRFNTIDLRGALFRSLYRFDHGRTDAPIATQPVDYAAEVKGMRPSPQSVALLQYADCVVRADEKDARAVTLSSTASSRERASIASLSPYFASCLAKGSQLTFSKTVLLGLIAEALYRLSATGAATVARK